MNQQEQLEELVEEEPAAAAAAAVQPEFPFVTLPPEISFATKQVQPPAECYINRGEKLRTRATNTLPGASVYVRARILRADGQITNCWWEYYPRSDGVAEAWDEFLPEGFLLSLGVFSGNLSLGQCYVRAGLMGAGGMTQVLISAYATALGALTWPYPRYENPVEGPGRIRLIVGTDPPAGTIITETVPAGVRWKLISVRCWLITSITAGDRYVSLALAINWVGDYFVHVPSVVTQPAGTTYYYNWAIGLTPYVSTSGNNIAASLPDQVDLTAGMQFRVVCGGLVATDNFSAPRYLVEEWVES